MGLLDKAALDALLAAGCSHCQKGTLVFQTYVDALVPLMDGEPVGKLAWVYDGERFLDGIYEVSCAHCNAVIFSSPDCPRCHAKHALDKALRGEDTYGVPKTCPGCGAEEVRYIALVPARVVYEGKRAEKARTSVELLDPGFHGYRVDCKTCGTVRELQASCPLCSAEGPIRARPD